MRGVSPSRCKHGTFLPAATSFVEMQLAATEASRTIAILSQEYLKSKYAMAEWAAALANDPKGSKRSLVLVRVGECEAPGLLKALVYIDLVGLDKDEARERLLEGISGKRVKPAEEPQFPGKQRTQTKTPPPFPGIASSAGAIKAPSRYMPKIPRSPTDLEKRRFIQTCFDTLVHHFKNALAETLRAGWRDRGRDQGNQRHEVCGRDFCKRENARPRQILARRQDGW